MRLPKPLLLGLGLILGTAAQAQMPKLRGTLVVANQRADTAFLIRLSDGKRVASLPTGHGPHEVAASPSGKMAIVTNYQDDKPSLLLIDIAKGQAIKTIELGEFTHPHGVRFLDEDHVLCTSERIGKLALVDVKTGKVDRGLETKGRLSHLVVVSSDGKFAYTGNVIDGTVSKIEIATGELKGQAKVGKGCEGIGISPDGKAVWTANRGEGSVSVVDTAKMETTKTIADSGLPYRVDFTPDGKYALVANPVAGTLDVFDAAKGELVKRIDAAKAAVTFTAEGGAPAIGGIAVHPEGRFVFCTVINAAAVAVIDLEKGDVVAKYEASVSPDGIAYSKIESAQCFA